MKQTLLLTLTAFSLIFCSPRLFAQSYRPGFIVKASGDTIQGLVKYRESKRKYKTCIFKTTESSTPQEYNPTDIIAYGITNDALFESRNIVNDEGVEISTFLEVLIHGKLSLYEHQDMFFLKKEKGKLTRIAAETNDPGIGGIVGEIRTTTTSTKHLVLLNTLTNDCPVPQELLAKVLKKITAPNIMAIVEAYNNCSEPASSITYRQDKPWLSAEKGVLIGSHTTRLKFYDKTNLVNDANFSVSHNIIVGGHLNLRSPRRSEKLSLHVDAFLSKEQYLGYQERHGPLIIHRNDYDIDITRVATVIMGRYTMANSGKAKPFLAIGATHNFILGSTTNVRFESETTINNIRQIDTNITESQVDMRYYTRTTAALGTTYMFKDKYKLLFQFRYERSFIIADRAFINSNLSIHLDKNNSFYLTTAYIFR